jgi:hypothetical protein
MTIRTRDTIALFAIALIAVLAVFTAGTNLDDVFAMVLAGF